MIIDSGHPRDALFSKENIMEIRISGISKAYRKKQILKDISLEGRGGVCIGLLGANGSGKSTLLSILAGVLRADSGSFVCDGVDLLKSGDKGGIVGYIPQGIPLIEELSGYDNLLMWYRKADLDRELEGGRLKKLGIDEFVKKQVSRLSGGMKKRISIGCAIAGNPKILLLDEPTAALDLVCKEYIADYVTDFVKGGGFAIIATHDLQELLLCDRLYILKDGVLEPFEYNGDVHTLVESL